MQRSDNNKKSFFDKVYAIALAGDRFELGKLIPLHPNPCNRYEISVSLLERKPDCYIRAAVFRGISVITQLAKDGHVDAVNFLCRSLPKYNSYDGYDPHIAYAIQGYAMAGNLLQVDMLIAENKTDKYSLEYTGSAVNGFAMSGMIEQADYYAAQNPDFCYNFEMISGLAYAGDIDLVVSRIKDNIKERGDSDPSTRTAHLVRAAYIGFALAGSISSINAFSKIFEIKPTQKDMLTISSFLIYGGCTEQVLELVDDVADENDRAVITDAIAALRSEDDFKLISAHNQLNDLSVLTKQCAKHLWIEKVNELLPQCREIYTKEKCDLLYHQVASIYSTIGLITPFLDLYRDSNVVGVVHGGFIVGGWIDQYIQVMRLFIQRQMTQLDNNVLKERFSKLNLDPTCPADTEKYTLMTATILAIQKFLKKQNRQTVKRLLCHVNDDSSRKCIATAYQSEDLDFATVCNKLMNERNMRYGTVIQMVIPKLNAIKEKYGILTYRQALTLRQKNSYLYLLFTCKCLTLIPNDVVVECILPYILQLKTEETRGLYIAVSKHHAAFMANSKKAANNENNQIALTKIQSLNATII